MRTIEENFKYIVNLLDVNYDEIYSRYILITMVGSVEVQDIRFFTERGIPLLTYLAKINNVSVADYIKYRDARNKTTEPSFESVGNLQRAIELIALDFQTTKWFNMREIKNSTISGKYAMLRAVADFNNENFK